MTIPIRKTGLLRNESFSFTCNRCRECCKNKKIQINPYETAQLARRLGMTTTRFIERFTVEEGAFLKFTEEGTCAFLGPDGCSVHHDRPLVCRLYPLARHVGEKGEEWFSELEPEPSCRGSYGMESTISEYLAKEDALPYMQAANIYLNLLWKLISALESQEESEQVEGSIEEAVTPENWMDIDAVVTDYCLRNRLQKPQTVNENMRLHIEALEQWIKPT
ncbi:MAG: YkgJ family cysteine cluster protein [Chlorobium sp.]|nr:YkgJ family cysteine cluster protein [Chlorobium sp.]MCF8217246.1 YkgJ family cysteine cluster protein [Chlorobium sp.]MCF8272104.1 YkgJ family cysteine cluster protein [Chlorobium sp.]MCF8288465.1 YkgJ family cysteine cluster protein [Chlorobium sp.]MCF8292055.1 YkgJ family cysteine cluster protein [Chlorobium sp.]MCF8386157.1 YkgJ family cysteine cluster protein [Chlorobium sp.]